LTLIKSGRCVALDLAIGAGSNIDASRPQEIDMLEFEVQAMSCGHCVGVITKAITALDPAAKVQCELPSHRVLVTTARPRAEVAHALKEAGYPPTPVL
jgi:copper chaperone